MWAPASDRSASLRSLLLAGALAAGACADPPAEEAPPPPDAGPACEEGARTCSAGGVAICEGGALRQTDPCPAGAPCVDGRCEQTCTSNQATCEGTLRKVCVEDGTGFWAEDCAPGVCRDGGCAACHPGTLVCLDDATVGRCNEAGTQVEEVASCDPAATKTFCHLGKCLSPCAISLKEASNVGCEYWAVDLDNTDLPPLEPDGPLAADAPFAVALSNVHPGVAAHVTIRTAHKIEAELVIEPGALEVAYLPSGNVDGTGVQPVARRIQSDMPLIAYQFNPLANVDVYSNDASMLLPGSSLGKSYVAVSREHQGSSNRGFVAIVATVDGTKVKVTASGETQGNNTGTQTFSGLDPGETRTFTLDMYDVLNLETLGYGDDLTGTRVEADQPVAVFGGSECAAIPYISRCNGGKCAETGLPCAKDKDCPSPCCCDHLEEQMFPVSGFGTRYLAARSPARGGEVDYWRVVAIEDGTTFETIPAGVSPVTSLDAGQMVEFGAADSFELTSNKPVALGQYLSGEQAPLPNVTACVGGSSSSATDDGTCKHDAALACSVHDQCVYPCQGPDQCEEAGFGRDAGTGDPSFVLLAPVTSFREDTIFLVPDKYAEDHVNVVIPAGVPLYADGNEVTGVPRTPIGSGDYELVWSRLSDGVHHLSAKQPFGVTVYGYDRYVSYGYAGGVSFASLKGAGP